MRVPVGTIPARCCGRTCSNREVPAQPERPRGDRYEFWVYRQDRGNPARRPGDIAADTSLRHLRFDDELISPRSAPSLSCAASKFPSRPGRSRHRSMPPVRGTRPALAASRARPSPQPAEACPVRPEGRGLSTRGNPEQSVRKSDSREGFYASLPQRGIADVFHFCEPPLRLFSPR